MAGSTPADRLMMTKKDYIVLAEVLKVAKTRANKGLFRTADGAVSFIALEIVALCEKQNPRFDRWKFGRAAGISEDNLDNGG